MVTSRGRLSSDTADRLKDMDVVMDAILGWAADEMLCWDRGGGGGGLGLPRVASSGTPGSW